MVELTDAELSHLNQPIRQVRNATSYYEPLPPAIIQVYTNRRDAGDSHQAALGFALNQMREDEKGMTWGAYERLAR